MKPLRSARLLDLFLCLTMLTAALTAPLIAVGENSAPPPAAVPVDPAPSALAPALDDLPTLALAGRFSEVRHGLESATDLTRTHPQVAGLVRDLKRYEEHAKAARQERLEEYHKALSKMDEASKAGKVDEALAYLIEAHAVAEEPAGTLEDPRAKTLISAADAAAKKAADEGDWLEGLGLYRSLGTLFDENSRFRQPIKDCERRTRMLRMYAPAELERLFTLRAKRLGKDKFEPPALGSETWSQMIEGCNLTMLEQSMLRAAKEHVSSPGYKPLLLGAVDDLIALGQTPSLSAAFATLKDKAKVNQFVSALSSIRDDIAGRKEIDSLDALRLIEQIMAANRASIDLPEPVMAYEMGDGATGMLDDFTSIIWPRDVAEFSRTTKGNFFGVGILISRKDGRLLVVTPLEDTPAQKAGVRAGDAISTVNGQSTAGWSLDQAVRIITGPEGTPVTLGLERTGSAKPVEVTLTRAKIMIKTVKGWQQKESGGWDYMIDPDSRIAYVRLSQFIPQSAEDIDQALNEAEKSGPINGLIFDLRGNPGGLLSSAVEIVNRFVKSGVIVSTVGADGKSRDEYKARPEKCSINYPVVVLINEGSASASEIVSGALQDDHRATIVGHRSFGKGSVQDLIPLDHSKAFLKLTMQYYALPSGRIIHRKPDAAKWGIEPDLSIDVTVKQELETMEFRQSVDIVRSTDDSPATQPAPSAQQILDKGIDQQLEAALALLKTRLVVGRISVAQNPVPANP